jgi:DNA repair protein RecN (Recombination protein N)
MDIDSDGEIIISRRFSENGKSSIKINGNAVTAAMLRNVTDCLVDVHGQSEHFFLLKESNQLKTLDGAIGETLSVKKLALHELLRQKKDVDERIALLGGDEHERGRRLDILSFQMQEIENVAILDGEEEELVAKRNKIQNLEKIITALREASGVFETEGGLLDGVRFAKRSLSSISRLDENYNSVLERLETLYSEAEDLAATLSDLGEELYFDENEAQHVEERLDAIRALKKKYGHNKAEIDDYYHNIRLEYELLSDSEGQYTKLVAEREKLNSKIYSVCKELTKIRKTFGADFCQGVTNELRTLNIASARFEIEFNDYSEEDVEKADKNGLDRICFLFSANAGEPLKPLGKIISGGEMSRFMLALKTRLSGVNEICTYLFDEIDAGISGKTAKVVGEKFAKIAKNTQIIAVSHLAQIAVMSDGEFLIEKSESEGKTLTNVKKLSEIEKKSEIVRLLGGSDNDEFAYKHAEELIKQALDYKQSL